VGNVGTYSCPVDAMGRPNIRIPINQPVENPESLHLFDPQRFHIKRLTKLQSQSMTGAAFAVKVGFKSSKKSGVIASFIGAITFITRYKWGYIPLKKSYK